MKRVTLYSRSVGPHTLPREAAGAPELEAPPAAPLAFAQREPGRLQRTMRRFNAPLLFMAGAAGALLILLVSETGKPPPRAITQKDIDAAVLRTLETKPLPSRAAQAYDLVKGAVVRVRGLGAAGEADKDVERSVGTGVVILDNGTILTNLHVVSGAKRLSVI
ncbi:MAG: S1C family serine protease, partial [Burkholderiales bacterium]